MVKKIMYFLNNSEVIRIVGLNTVFFKYCRHALAFLCVMLISLGGIDVRSVHANSIQSLSGMSLQHIGDALLKTLSIHHYDLVSDAIVFGRKQYVWGFQEKEGFTTLLKRLEQSPHPFESIEVIGNTFFLRAELAQGEAIFIVKRNGQHAYSGSLSITGMAPGKNKIHPILWLPSQATLLMDIEGESMRQFIYILPFTLVKAKEFLHETIQKYHWKPQENFGSAFQVWTKNGKQLMYFIDNIEGKSVLYIIKKEEAHK